MMPAAHGGDLDEEATPSYHGRQGAAGRLPHRTVARRPRGEPTRQAAGLGRQRLRVVMPPSLPDALAVETASALRSAAAAEVEIAWLFVPC
jgi:hypothetical protein